MRPDVDTDERPFVLIWELTQACDLACKHCRADAQPDRHPDELTTAEGKALLEEARRFGENQLVVLSGGDPLKRDDVVDLVDYGTDLGLQMTLTPSGTDSLTADRIEALAAAGLRRLALSIDGSTRERHDAFRDEDGSFDSTLAAAEAAREAGLPLQVNTTVCAETVDDLPLIRDLVDDLGAVLWSVFFLVPVGRGTALDPIPAPKGEQVMEWLHDVQQEADFGIKTTEAPHYRRVAAQMARDREGESVPDGSRGHAGGRGSAGDGNPDAIGRRTGIIAGDGFAFVSHLGDIYPSGFLPAAAGNVREDSLVECYRHADLFERLRDRDELKGKCGACEFRYLCGGSRSRAFAYTGDPLEADPLCPYVPAGYDGPMPDESPRRRSPAGRSAGD